MALESKWVGGHSSQVDSDTREAVKDKVTQARECPAEVSELAQLCQETFILEPLVR